MLFGVAKCGNRAGCRSISARREKLFPFACGVNLDSVETSVCCLCMPGIFIIETGYPFLLRRVLQVRKLSPLDSLNQGISSLGNFLGFMNIKSAVLVQKQS